MNYCYCKNRLYLPVTLYRRYGYIPEYILRMLYMHFNHIRIMGDLIIGIKMDDVEYWEYVIYNGEKDTYEFLNDWYEGESEVTLFFVAMVDDFKMIDDINIKDK